MLNQLKTEIKPIALAIKNQLTIASIIGLILKNSDDQPEPRSKDPKHQADFERAAKDYDEMGPLHNEMYYGKKKFFPLLQALLRAIGIGTDKKPK